MNRIVDITLLVLCISGIAALAASCDQRNRGDSTRDDPLIEAGNTSFGTIEAQLADIGAELERLVSYRTIIENELQYTRGLDRHDEQLINDSFYLDAQASYGTLVNMDALAVWANESHATYAGHQHHVTGISADIAKDVAHTESYIIFSSDMKRDPRLDEDGAATPGRVPSGTYASLGTGRYLNRYERREDQWKIRVHEYVHEISMRLEAVDLCAIGCLGRWDRSDISYIRPLEPLSAAERRRRVEESKTPHAAVE